MSYTQSISDDEELDKLIELNTQRARDIVIDDIEDVNEYEYNDNMFSEESSDNTSYYNRDFISGYDDTDIFSDNDENDSSSDDFGFVPVHGRNTRKFALKPKVPYEQIMHNKCMTLVGKSNITITDDDGQYDIDAVDKFFTKKLKAVDCKLHELNERTPSTSQIEFINMIDKFISDTKRESSAILKLISKHTIMQTIIEVET